jgi:hypothetical protein
LEIPVGSGQCTHGTIQSAINRRQQPAPACRHTIRLTRSLTYEPEANSINTSQELTVEGGYATCTQATSDAHEDGCQRRWWGCRAGVSHHRQHRRLRAPAQPDPQRR